MHPMDPRATALIGRDHGVTTRVLASINGSDFVLPVQLVSGSITVDAKSPARRVLDAKVVATLDSPVVDPFGTELRVEYGLVDPTTGETFWTPVGTFVVTAAQEDDGGLVSVKGSDRWLRVTDARLERSVKTSGDTLDAITSLLTGADSRITVDTSAAPTGFTHRASVWARDRDKAIIKLAESIGCVVWFTALGVAKVAPIPALDADPSWLISGGAGGVKVRSTRGVTRDRTYNAIQVIGEPGGNKAAVSAVRRDTSSRSRTKWGGPFGKKPAFFSSQYISSTAQATRVATNMLDRVRNVSRTVVVETVQHPGLDGYDIVNAQLSGTLFQRLRVGSFQLTLGLATMTITAASDAPETEVQ